MLLVIENWNLEFVWILVLGFWDFMLRLRMQWRL